jgi:hypothetical protein
LIVTGETRVVSGKVLLKFLNGAGISAGEKIAFLDTTTLVGGENLEIEVEGLEEPFEAVLTPDGEITAITDGIPTTEPSLMDVRPGKPNNINIVSEQVFPVAILASRGGLLENISNLDISSLRFGPAEAPIDDKSPSFKDVNGDSLDDIVVWFRVSETGLSCDDSQVEIYGKTNDGQDFNATDFVQASGCNSPSSIPSLEDLAPPAPL